MSAFELGITVVKLFVSYAKLSLIFLVKLVEKLLGSLFDIGRSQADGCGFSYKPPAFCDLVNKLSCPAKLSLRGYLDQHRIVFVGRLVRNVCKNILCIGKL